MTESDTYPISAQNQSPEFLKFHRMNPKYDLTLWKFAGYEPRVSIRWDQERATNHPQAVSVHHDEQRKLLFLISYPFYSFIYSRQCWFVNIFYLNNS